MNSQNRQSILLEKHARSLTKKLYDVTLGNLLGYNKKFFIGQFLLTNSQSKSNKQFLFTLWKAAIFALGPVRRRTALISRPECLTGGFPRSLKVNM
jgi:hypothetical protein